MLFLQKTPYGRTETEGQRPPTHITWGNSAEKAFSQISSKQQELHRVTYAPFYAC